MSEYIRLEHSNPEHSQYFVVNWCLGNTCNFSCTYCPKSLHDGSVDFVDFETARDFCDRTIVHYRNLDPDKKFYFEFTGGEVTLFKDFLKLAAHLKAEGCKVGLISNGSRSIDYWTKAVPHIDHVCLSFHPEGCKKDHFEKVVEFLRERIRVHVNIMMLPEQFDECWRFAGRIAGLGNISMAIQPLIIDFGSQLFGYTDEQLSRIENQHKLIVGKIKMDRGFEYYRGSMAKVSRERGPENMAPQKFIAMKENNWNGWLCHAGLEQIVIDMHGKISRGWCLVGKPIGNVIDKNIQFPDEGVICTKSMCHCNFDIMSSKRNLKYDGFYAGQAVTGL